MTALPVAADTTVTTGDATTNVTASNTANNNEAEVKGQGGDQHITIKGNGAFSDNNVQARTHNETNVEQTNDTDIDNDINVNSNTGNNTAGFNTGGDVRIHTGDANTNVTVNDTAGNNVLKLDGCDDCKETTITLSGNGAFSNNTVRYVDSNTVNVNQNNITNIENNINVNANTGNNGSYAIVGS